MAITRPISPLFATLLVCTAAYSHAASNIDPGNSGQKYGWSENGGWVNLQGNMTHGVHVGSNLLQGFAWHENFGWINFGDGTPSGDQYSNTSASDFGVNIDETGNLSGYAWGENIGWINLDNAQVYVGFAEQCPGDTNGDGVVNFTDLNAVLSTFGMSGAPGFTGADVNNDGVVNFTDLNIVLSNFGVSC